MVDYKKVQALADGIESLSRRFDAHRADGGSPLYTVTFGDGLKTQLYAASEAEAKRSGEGKYKTLMGKPGSATSAKLGDGPDTMDQAAEDLRRKNGVKNPERRTGRGGTGAPGG